MKSMSSIAQSTHNQPVGSLGGEVAVMLAAQHPELFTALIIGDAPLSIQHHLTEEPAEHRAQNRLRQTLCGRSTDEIEAAIRRMPVYVPSEHFARPAHEVLGDDCPVFAQQAFSLHQLDPEMLAAVNSGPQLIDVPVGQGWPEHSGAQRADLR